VIETIIDKAAYELGIEPVELRRRNTIPREAMPFTTVLQQTYDSGDFVKNLDDCLALADYRRVAERRDAAKTRGKLLGVGVATAVAASGGRDYEHAEIRFDPSGGVVLMTGSMDHGQGHGTTFKQVLSEKLGIDSELIRYRYGDSDLVTMGIGTFGSRSAQLAGSAIVVAADRLIGKGRKIAAHMMEAGVHDVDFADGKFTIAGTDRSVGIIERPASRKSQFRSSGLRDLPQRGALLRSRDRPGNRRSRLDPLCRGRRCRQSPQPAALRGADPRRDRPGAGQALMEDLVYDQSSGQLLTGSFQDYAMPRAGDFCPFELANNPTLTDRNPLGVKGVGEAGTLCAIPAVMNAVNDALVQAGLPFVEAPATSEKVWRALRSRRD
jgi:aerobic carbon-monoxide dehydrogenase large subunit